MIPVSAEYIPLNRSREQREYAQASPALDDTWEMADLGHYRNQFGHSSSEASCRS